MGALPLVLVPAEALEHDGLEVEGFDFVGEGGAVDAEGLPLLG